MVVTFQLEGQDFIALNGGPQFTFSSGHFFRSSIARRQQEVDNLWEKLSEGGKKNKCGWLEDKYGLHWQIVPAVLRELMQDKDPEKSKSVMQAMLQMDKIDIQKLKQAYASRRKLRSRGGRMSAVRVLAGTRKGGFVLTADGKREKWEISGPHFGGWEIYHMKGSPADPNRIYASQSSGWFGQVMQRSNDGGKTWEAVGNKFVYDGVPGTHQWYDGKPHPWEFKRVWHLEPSLTDPDTVYAGVEDAALFKSTDGGQNWTELSGLRNNETGPRWQPGAGGMCLHSILLDPGNPNRMYIAISAAGAFRTDDGGKTWKPINKGLHSQFLPDPTAEVGHCVHHIAMHQVAAGRPVHAKALGRYAQ